jgi:hypothetical protein
VGGPERLEHRSHAAPLCASTHALAFARVIADTDPGDMIPLVSVGKEALDKTIEYMEKMAAFKAEGTSDEDKLAWVRDYKKTMEAQDQLPLLLQTMSAANLMNVKPLLEQLDELLKHDLAEMGEQRTWTWSATPPQRARRPCPELGCPHLCLLGCRCFSCARTTTAGPCLHWRV